MNSLSQSLGQTRFLQLSQDFHAQVKPTPLQLPYFVSINERAAALLDISVEQLKSSQSLAILAGADVLPENSPIATVYAGHQFGIYTSKLGDGRAHILGDIVNERGERWELQLKGSGKTPFSRGNNGRMDLASSIREYLGCSAMAGLGIATTQGLCVIGESEDRNDERQSILARFAKTHIRFGHFEYFHNQRDYPSVQKLADHVINNYYPQLLVYAVPERYNQLLFTVTENTAQLVAQWQANGFVHGVMNTDNMSIIADTIDYGPYAFMEAYNSGLSPNQNDEQARYAFNQQSEIGLWNCLAFAEALTSLLPAGRIPTRLLRHYRTTFTTTYNHLMRSKLGLVAQRENDEQLIQDILTIMETDNVDYTVFFRRLSHYPSLYDITTVSSLFQSKTQFKTWMQAYKQRVDVNDCSYLARNKAMLACNPKFILRKHLIEFVVHHAVDKKDYQKLEILLFLLQDPFKEHTQFNHYC